MGLPTFQEAAFGVIAPTLGDMLGSYPVSGLSANDLFVIQVYIRNTSTTANTPSGFTLLYGPDSNGTSRQYLYGKVSNGAESGTYVLGFNFINDTAVAKIVRCYRFRGTSTGTYFEAGVLGTNVNTVLLKPTLTTLTDNSLGAAFSYVSSNLAVGNLEGEIGADFTEPVEEWTTPSGSAGMIDLQTAGILVASAIVFGSASLSSSVAWGMRALALKPDAFIDATAMPGISYISLILNSPTVKSSSGTIVTPTLITVKVILNSPTIVITNNSVAVSSTAYITLLLNSPSVNISKSSTAIPDLSLISIKINSPAIVTSGGVLLGVSINFKSRIDTIKQSSSRIVKYFNESSQIETIKTKKSRLDKYVNV